jgi:hypothetical protein
MPIPNTRRWFRCTSVSQQHRAFLQERYFASDADPRLRCSDAEQLASLQNEQRDTLNSRKQIARIDCTIVVLLQLSLQAFRDKRGS